MSSSLTYPPAARPSRLRRLGRLVLAATAAAVATLTAAREAAAQPLALTPGRWLEFSFFDGLGPVDEYGVFGDASGWSSEGLFLAVAAPVTVRVVDAQVAGDVFDLFVNGALRLTTSTVGAVDLGVGTGATTGEAAALDPRLSRGALRLGPGSYLLTVAARETPPDYVFGNGFIRADLATASTVPEPGTVTLLATGLLAAGVAGARARRRDAGRTAPRGGGR